MGFRGIFLQRSQNPDDRGAAKFEVLCAEAELCLLVERQTMSDIDPSGVVDTKVLVKNAATTDLLFVARMADVTMEVGSMFWVDGTTVYCFRFVSDNSYAEVLRAVDALRRTEQLALMRSVLAFHPLGGSDGKDNPTKWKHYAACAKLDTTGAEEIPSSDSTAATSKPSKPRKQVEKVPPPTLKKKGKVAPSTLPPGKTARNSAAQPPRDMVDFPQAKRNKPTCTSGPVSEKRRIAEAKAYNKEWLITIDPKQPSNGPSCHLCRRRQGKMFTCPSGVADHVFCGRCMFYKFKLNLTDFFDRGVHYSCRLCSRTCDCTGCSAAPPDAATLLAMPRRLSIPLAACLLCGTTTDSLVSHPHLLAAQLCPSCVDTVAGVPSTGCDVCGYFEANDPVRPCEHCSKACCPACVLKLGTVGCPLCEPAASSTGEQPLVTASGDDGAAPVAAMSPPPIDPQDGLTYFVSYVQSILHRETRRSPPKLSEDSCFCCKDGGDLIECDFVGKHRCPKVYHVDCLGFSVPDDVTWTCPRHLCAFPKCTHVSKFICRFCPVAHCEVGMTRH
ncbi:hypothetical protein, variant 1 [Aphanomyces invadans]|uniref:RING-type domain-containing protein n=1 Tax=Aphanomyces invadans TaxID=157072 RepID=A0A024UM90_9STRA|nr:hypothetical protein, variant 1 [Aphanomyces invadans]ETW06952.1 hypothetical protein, variant 1 [Aphanomyces invadans]|eukprot:XP_008865027.1 hypothetical protein, variant 1 [Aphanomyces invadans]